MNVTDSLNNIRYSFFNIFRLDFVRNVMTLSTGVVIAHAISLASSPIITRLFTPENFGLLAIFSSLMGIIVTISSLCYERAIVLPKKDSDAVKVMVLSTIILFLVCFMCLALVGFLRDSIAVLLGSEELSFWLLVIPIGALLGGFLNILRFWAIRIKYFRDHAATSIIQTGVGAIIKIATGFLIGAWAGGLIYGALIGVFFAVLFLFIKTIKDETIHLIRGISINSIKQVASEYKKFPYYASWNALLNAVSQSIIVFLFAIFFTPAVVGFYHLGNRVLRMPLAFLSQSVNKVYFQKAALQYASGQEILDGFKKTTFVLITLGILPFVILSFFGSPLFSFVFGKEWSEAGLYVQILAPWLFFGFINAPSNVIYDIMAKQDIKLLYELALIIFRVVSIIGGYAISQQAIIVLYLYSTVGVVFNIIFITLAYHFCMSHKRILAGQH